MPTGKRNSRAKFATGVFAASTAVAVLVLGMACASAQEPASIPATDAGNQQKPDQQSAQQSGKQINVNWLYGSFVPKDVPLVPLTPHQRFQLYLRTTYITWGIYFKTLFFAAQGQIKNTPPEWGGGASGYAKRALSYQGQFIIQNSITAGANAFVGWEPRYELCRCSGIGPRTWHAVKRNFITYNSTDNSLRPQLMPYVGAAGAAAITAVAWQPGNPNPGIKAYQAAVTQVFVGVGVDVMAEFIPDVKRLLRRNKDKNKKSAADQRPETASTQ